MSIKNAIASLAVKDMERAVPWYEAFLGRPADEKPLREVAEWKFPDGGGLQVYELPVRAGGCSCTLAVSNLEEEERKLTKMGVQPGDRPSNAPVNVIMIKDPDGNSIALSEAVDH